MVFPLPKFKKDIMFVVTSTVVKFFIFVCFIVLCALIVRRYLNGDSGTYQRLSGDLLVRLWAPGRPQAGAAAPFSGGGGGGQRSKGEEAVCRALQELYGCPFTTQRPDFLRSPVTGQNLEIDCYNETLKIGAEYNGRQHYEFTPKFHRSVRDFREGQYRDVLKNKLCQEHGVTLITVPYTVPIRLIKQFIARKLPTPAV